VLGDPSGLAEFLSKWRWDIKEQLRTNSGGHLGKKYGGLGVRVPKAFPNLDIVNAYVYPLTSWSDGRHGPDLVPLNYRVPDVQQIAAFCERLFTWGGMNGTLSKLHNLLWKGVCLRMLFEVRAFFTLHRLFIIDNF
jgi:holliday junction resolvase YEN1